MFFTKQNRLDRERRTIQFMIEIYCGENHSPAGEICPACQELAAYAIQRIEKCPFQADKPTCAQCPIHCYKPAMRERVRHVMRFSGPRMLFSHPILAILHLLDEKFKKAQPRQVS